MEDHDRFEDSTTSKRLFVAKLNPSLERRHFLKQDLLEHFSRFGNVQTIFLSGRNCTNHKIQLMSDTGDRNMDSTLYGGGFHPAVPPFAFVDMETEEQAGMAIADFNERKEQRGTSYLFGYLAYGTKDMEDVDQSLKQQWHRKQVAATIRQERRELLQEWADTSPSDGNKLVLEIHKSHQERLKEWLETLQSDEGTKMCKVATSSIPVSKSASLLLLNATLNDPTPLVQRIRTTWYVASNVHRIMIMDRASDAAVEGSLCKNVAPAILDRICVERQKLGENGPDRGELSDASASEKSMVVRLIVSPTKLQMPLLKILWGNLDTQNDKGTPTAIDFSHDGATHSLSVIQAYGDVHDKEEGIYLIGRLESPSADQRDDTVNASNVSHVDSDNLPNEASLDHEEWKIALYYVYVDLPPPVLKQHIDFQKRLCKQLQLNGRVRVSQEGINGVLSGRLTDLETYEREFAETLRRLRSATTGGESTFSEEGDEHKVRNYHNHLDMKYCHLRKNLPVQSQLFDRLMVKETKTVINLFDGIGGFSKSMPSTSRKSSRYRRRKERKASQPNQVDKEGGVDLSSLHQAVMKEPLRPSPHLSATDWNQKLDDIKSSDDALLIDVRNVYESRVGHFVHPTTPTLLTNTRKYSDLVSLLASNPQLNDTKRKQVFMYCTGGVRCERVSMLVNQLYPDKQIYQLKGGIQSYLRDCKEQHEQSMELEEKQYFVGKNFVFDPRRTDPVHFGEVVGQCLVCGAAHDDYDNGHSPNDNREARCNKCRMLVLVCNDCRPKWRCHGETSSVDDDEEGDDRPLLFCNLDHCVHEGAAPEPTLVYGKDRNATRKSMEDDDDNNTIVCRAYQKLKEAWERYSFEPPPTLVSTFIAIDCGAAPGGWSKFLLETVHCRRVYAVDPANMCKSVLHDERLLHMPMKIQDALPVIQKELSGSAMPPVTIWLVGPGTFFILTLKLVKGHATKTFDLLVREQVQRLLEGEGDFHFEKVHVLHLFSNRVRERTIIGYCS
ncbi:rhodanese domain containing protein [Nitzschia inconspicua]|uniref:Rhodanese domain containing protein n=1 Tax=Nitzschia inconspicua TaxID=303405 RepID=A0A9K3LS99_9STRA|nr:rhodanese domain containing protein [Nitzschia inconspicua]